MPVSVALFGVAIFLAIALIAIRAARFRRGGEGVYAATFLCSLAGLLSSFAFLVSPGGEASVVILPVGLPFTGAHFRVDALAAFFLIVVNLGGAIASFYGIGYGRHEQEPARVLPFFPVFLAGMNLVVLADDAFTFLLGWEVMSLASWALVLAQHRVKENVRAGYIYLVMTFFGTLALLLAFSLLAGPDGNYAFDSIRDQALTPALAAIVLALTLLGAGTKAGLAPVHVWLPVAHPAAPSHVSALMSGVMTKVAVYAFIRVVFDLLGSSQWWFAAAVLIIAAATTVLGVLHALMEHDLKRLLAYHTIENVGIIFIGLGLAMAFQANRMPAAAALAMTAALFHVLNHSLFKSLLFFGAGAVLTATGERNMEHLGGLIHRMPQTAFAFLVGAVAISALPPLNGFVSEWLVFQSILVSSDLPQWILKFLAPATGAALALAAALAAACFVKAFGITFLGRPRSVRAEKAVEADVFQISAMGVLVLLCFLAGIFPGYVIDMLAPVVRNAVGANMSDQSVLPWMSIVPVSPGRSSYNGLLILAFIVMSVALALFAVRCFSPKAVRRSVVWDCGFPDLNPAAQYTSGSFSQPVRRIFGAVFFQAEEHVSMPPPGSTLPARLDVKLRDPAWDWIYTPLGAAVFATAGWMNRFRSLTVRRYLGVVFGVLVTLLTVLAIWR
ncbi:MAG: hydrogenase 4 subunit B [Pseudomonadota bacterium]